MSDSFVEYVPIRVTAPLRQGDVLESVDPLASKWQQHLLVITADCDLAFDKNQGRITCVPLLQADDYLMEMHIPRIRERSISKCVDRLKTSLEKMGLPAISPERLRTWPTEVSTTEILRCLDLKPSDAAITIPDFEAISLACRPFENLDEAIGNLLEALLLNPNAKSRENQLKEIQQYLRGPYTSPPGDALFLSSLAPTHQEGYFAYLRHLEQVHEPDIALGPSRSGAHYRRISRLKDRYIHAMVQRFALVFMSIGLPPEYEEMRDLYSENIGARVR